MQRTTLFSITVVSRFVPLVPEGNGQWDRTNSRWQRDILVNDVLVLQIGEVIVVCFYPVGLVWEFPGLFEVDRRRRAGPVVFGKNENLSKHYGKEMVCFLVGSPDVVMGWNCTVRT